MAGFERYSGKWFIPELLATPTSQVFFNDSAQIQRAYLDIAVEIAKVSPAIAIIDSNGIPTHNHLVRKGTLNHLAKMGECSFTN